MRSSRPIGLLKKATKKLVSYKAALVRPPPGLLTGALVGGAIGGGLGYGHMQTGLTPGFWSYIFFGLVGAVVGFVAGKPFWKHKTMYTPFFKAVFGFGACLGLYALAHNTIGGLSLGFIQEGATLSNTPPVFGVIIGVSDGAFVGLDDALGDRSDDG